MIERRLIQEMLELRGGKTRLKEIREELEKQIGELTGTLQELNQLLDSSPDNGN